METLSLKQLYTFLLVAQTGSFQATARRLNATQPAISNRVAQLEQALGVQLFDRSTRHCHPTPAGRSLIAYAQRVVAAAAELRANIGRPDALGGRVVLGVVETIALTWLPAVLTEVGRRMPRLAVEVDVDVSGRLTTKLEAGDVDLACVVAPAGGDRVVGEPLGAIDLVWVASPAIAVPPGPLSPEALADHPVIVHTGSRHTWMVERWLRRATRLPLRLTGCNSLSTIVRLTVAGGGLALVPRTAVADELAQGRLRIVPFTEPLPPNPYLLAYRPDRADVPTLAVLEVVKDVAATRMAAPPASAPPAVRR